MFETVNRADVKREMKSLLRDARVNSRAFAALYLGLGLLLSAANQLSAGAGAVGLDNPLALFVRILTGLLSVVLLMGFILYCMTVRKGQRAEFLTLFDGFSFAWRAVSLAIIQYFFIVLWTMLFVVPGFVAAYRYRFAYYNLCENPQLGAMDALNMSKRQTVGYKGQLLLLDLSYIGWGLLATLPAFIWTSYTSYTSAITAAGGTSVTLEFSAGAALCIQLLCALWGAAVQLFFLPAFQCAELGYYETAKRTSGVSPVPVPPPDSPADGHNPGIDDFL